MPVLIEALSVVLRVDRMKDKIPKGSPVLEQLSTHPSFCGDGELLRIAFMRPDDVRAFVEDMETLGLRHVVKGEDGPCAEDLAVVDQMAGPTTRADWLEYRHVDLKPDGSQPVATARLKDGKETRTVFPKVWRWEGSISQQATFVPDDKADELVEYVRTEGNEDVYRDRKTGELRRVPRRQP